MKKVIIISSIALLLFITGLIYLQTKKSSPEFKVDQLQQEKASKVTNSGYNECLQKVKNADTKREENEKNCNKTYLESKGYTDSITCVGTQSADPLCQTTARYNAEVEANNKCMEEFKIDPNQLTELDCAKLLEKK